MHGVGIGHVATGVGVIVTNGVRVDVGVGVRVGVGVAVAVGVAVRVAVAVAVGVGVGVRVGVAVTTAVAVAVGVAVTVGVAVAVGVAVRVGVGVAVAVGVAVGVGVVAVPSTHENVQLVSPVLVIPPVRKDRIPIHAFGSASSVAPVKLHDNSPSEIVQSVVVPLPPELRATQLSVVPSAVALFLIEISHVSPAGTADVRLNAPLHVVTPSGATIHAPEKLSGTMSAPL